MAGVSPYEDVVVRGQPASLSSRPSWPLPTIVLCAAAWGMTTAGTQAASPSEAFRHASPPTAGRQVDPRPQQRIAASSLSRRPPTRVAMTNDPMTIIDDGHGEMMIESATSPPCATCQTRTPPWHGNVSAPGACGAACDPCVRSYETCRPTCFPRLHALWSEGYLPAPIPPCEPRCRQCGTMIETGF